MVDVDVDVDPGVDASLFLSGKPILDLGLVKLEGSVKDEATPNKSAQHSSRDPPRSASTLILKG